jgi:hypothetical protein
MIWRKHKKPSDKQLKFLALIEENPLMPIPEAARLAGYAESTVHNVGRAVLNKPMVKSLLDNYRYELQNHGVNPARLAKKIDELLEASNPVYTKFGQPVIDKQTGKQMMRPDRKIQLGTVKLIHDVYGVKADPKESEGIKRRLTLEEFEDKEGVINGEDITDSL